MFWFMGRLWQLKEGLRCCHSPCIYCLTVASSQVECPSLTREFQLGLQTYSGSWHVGGDDPTRPLVFLLPFLHLKFQHEKSFRQVLHLQPGPRMRQWDMSRAESAQTGRPDSHLTHSIQCRSNEIKTSVKVTECVAELMNIVDVPTVYRVKCQGL